MQFLVANDDGILAKGVQILTKTLKNFGEVTVYCPDGERSANSHAITTKVPLRVQQINFMDKVNAFAVNGTPADCAMLGLMQMQAAPPDYVIGGINMGVNIGQDIYYSGTLSVAREAVLKGYKGIAISMVSQELTSRTEERLINDLSNILGVIFNQSWIERSLLSVNLPNYNIYDKAKGVKVLCPDIESIKFSLVEDKDLKGREIFWSIDQTHGIKGQENTEKYWLEAGYIILSPIKISQIHPNLTEQVRIWFEDHTLY